MSKDQRRPDSGSWDRFWAADAQGFSKKASWAKQRICRIAAPYAAAGYRVLDAGCGSGYFSRYFFELGAQVTALDYSNKALALARAATGGRVQTVRADLVREDLAAVLAPAARYDLIFSDGLFEHFESREQDRILENFMSVLAGDGVILTAAPNRWSPWQILRPFMMPGITEEPFVLSGLRAMHERCGLQVIDSGGMNVLPFRLSPEFLGSAFGMLLYTVAAKRLDRT
jgi:SAM-dependent methyltransferase